MSLQGEFNRCGEHAWQKLLNGSHYKFRPLATTRIIGQRAIVLKKLASVLMRIPVYGASTVDIPLIL